MTGRSDVRALLARATAFRLVARAFAYPGGAAARETARAIGRLEIDGAWSPRVARAMRRARGAWVRTDDGRARAEYARLFLGSGPCSMHETAYGDGRRIAGRTAELADIGGFHVAFGVEAAASAPDLSDHLCAELEFHSILLVKLAYARRRGWTAGERTTARAARKFVEDHLGRWVRPFVESLAVNTAATPYRESATWLAALVAEETARLRARPASAVGRLKGDFMQEDEFVCPRDGEPVPGGARMPGKPYDGVVRFHPRDTLRPSV